MSDAADDRTVTLKFGDLSIDVEKLSSSDAHVEASVQWQVICLLSEYIATLRSRCWLDYPSRAERIEAAGIKVYAILADARKFEDDAELAALVSSIGTVFGELLPYAPEDRIPDAPNEKAMERLARVYEARRTAFCKLIRELIVDPERKDPDTIERIGDFCRDPGAMAKVLDSII